MRTYVILCLISLGIGAGVTRVYFSKETLSTEVVTIEHTVTVTQETKKPDGTTNTTTTTTEDKKQAATHNESKPVVQSTTSIHALAGMDVNFKPVYGLEVSKQLLGPIEVGAWGMTNGTIGISVGVRF